mmetsp:Transcript_46128/g.121880  ORF Transcript_46128/g.121880 Transcript_46128/m.121880 type:complete len:214 (+) Transcript_46128:585-1226(+)
MSCCRSSGGSSPACFRPLASSSGVSMPSPVLSAASKMSRRSLTRPTSSRSATMCSTALSSSFLDRYLRSLGTKDSGTFTSAPAREQNSWCSACSGPHRAVESLSSSLPHRSTALGEACLHSASRKEQSPTRTVLPPLLELELASLKGRTPQTTYRMMRPQAQRSRFAGTPSGSNTPAHPKSAILTQFDAMGPADRRRTLSAFRSLWLMQCSCR